MMPLPCSRAFLTAGIAYLTALTAGVAADPIPPIRSVQADLHLFLLVGQSNMAGRGTLAPQDQEIVPHILMLNAQDAWVPAVDPLHFDKPVAGTGLARSFASAYLAAHPGATVGLIPSACGGSPIAAWTPGSYFDETHSHPYDDAIRRTRLAQTRGTLRGILWHQGESDARPGLAEGYREALFGLIARFRRDLNADEVPFLIGQLGRFDGAPWGEATQLIDAAMQTVAAECRLVGFVRADGLRSKPDNLHFDSDSLRELGRRYFAVFRATSS